MGKWTSHAGMILGLLVFLGGGVPMEEGRVVSAAQPPDAQETADRDKILHSPRWRRMQESLAQWLEVQKIYTAAEVAQLKAGLKKQIAAMSATELADFLVDTEERLAVLLSDQAHEARLYLDVLNQRARRRLVAPDGQVPNVFKMSAGQLREELQKFRDKRAVQAQAYAQSRRAQQERVARRADLMKQQEEAREETRREDRERAIWERERAAERAAAEAARRGQAFSQYAPLNQRRQWYISPWGVFYY
ncbi:MAG: hypothetical protein GTO03_07750 [Planctomycetales bacterium]|nr:hypothetical protein [Planctomycetales bacterium]